jgi:glycosyltransferase involved in cell wall biosynthesis
MGSPSFSAVILTLNEEIHIQDCLAQLRWCDERILVDMQSTDQTRERAKDLATNIILHEPNPNFEFARNRGIEAASGDWILVVDADEIIPESLALRLRERASTAPGDVVGFWIPRMNYCFGRPLRHAGGFPDYQLRAFRRGAGLYPERLHGAPDLHGKTLQLPIEEGAWILHRRKNASIRDLLAKWDEYAATEARNRVGAGEQFPGPLAMLWTFLSAFRFRFFGLQGYRDGMAGLVLSVLLAFYRFEAEAKVWEAAGCDARWDPEVHRLCSASRLLWALVREGVRRLCRQRATGPSKPQARGDDPVAHGRC